MNIVKQGVAGSFRHAPLVFCMLLTAVDKSIKCLLCTQQGNLHSEWCHQATANFSHAGSVCNAFKHYSHTVALIYPAGRHATQSPSSGPRKQDPRFLRRIHRVTMDRRSHAYALGLNLSCKPLLLFHVLHKEHSLINEHANSSLCNF